VPNGVLPVPKLPPTPSNRVRTRPGLAVRARPAGSATASTRESLAAPRRPRAPSSACPPHTSAAPSSAHGSPSKRPVVTPTSIAEHLERQSVVPIESTIPTDMTVAQWRRQRYARPGIARRRSARLFAAARRLVPVRPVPCDHLHDTTTRYDQVEKLLSFLLICPVCGTEKLVETKPYAPHFTPHKPGPSHATLADPRHNDAVGLSDLPRDG
jgi:hypothetical protein